MAMISQAPWDDCLVEKAAGVYELVSALLNGEEERGEADSDRGVVPVCRRLVGSLPIKKLSLLPGSHLRWHGARGMRNQATDSDAGEDEGGKCKKERSFREQACALEFLDSPDLPGDRPWHSALKH